MAKQFFRAFFAVLLVLVFSCQVATAKEDTAQITLSKTALPKSKLYTYTVKKGDILSVIVRNIPGITEKDIADNYLLIQELNPNIKDVNKLSVGQKLILPGKPHTEEDGQKIASAASPEAQTQAVSTVGTKTYVIKEGDNLFRIVVRELGITSNVKEKLELIKSINPHIKDVTKIYAGDTILLPTKDFSPIPTAKQQAAVTEEEKLIEESISHPETIIEAKDKIAMPPEARLAVIKHVVTQMNATVTASGNYYLPLPKGGQVTIDCSKMPVIEFENNTTIFLDLENRAPDDLKNIISDNWKNFSLVKVTQKDDVIVVLRKIFDAAKNYSMTKQNKPLTIGAPLSAEFFVDWVIKETTTRQIPPLTQGLRILYENDLLFPRALKNFAQRKGLIITEISAQKGIVGKPEEIYSLPPVTKYPSTSAKEFSYALLSDLGLRPEKDVDIKIFDTEKDGINLSIKADVLVNTGDSKYIVFSRELSPQLINVLTQAGNKLIFLSDNDSPKYIMERMLQAMNIPSYFGHFSFSGLERKQASFTLSFSGTKIKTSKDIYVIDFNIAQEIRGLLQEMWSANIAEY